MSLTSPTNGEFGNQQVFGSVRSLFSKDRRPSAMQMQAAMNSMYLLVKYFYSKLILCKPQRKALSSARRRTHVHLLHPPCLLSYRLMRINGTGRYARFFVTGTRLHRVKMYDSFLVMRTV